ncbi:MAG: hypothetical protein JXR69_06290 [Candidatus Delongbacteria bacterium]|nr:hypothetical protein [Candidatus Delongbacteria bacterium]
MSDTHTGYRKIVDIGNVNQNTTWTIKNLPYGEYYWSVQAIDHNYTGSEFAKEQLVWHTDAPQNLRILRDEDHLNIFWNSKADATSYSIYSSDDPYAQFPEDWTLEANNIITTLWSDYKIRPNKKFYRVVAVSDDKK